MNKYEYQLIKDIETRLRTIMIGSLSRIENTFGYLWNHGADPETPSQNQFADKWENLRLEILNHGNNQIRSAIDELNDFFIRQNKYSYSYKFILNNNKDRR